MTCLIRYDLTFINNIVRLNMKLLVKLLVGLCIVFMVSSCGGSSTPEAAAKKYIEAVYDGDADKAIAMIELADKDKNAPGVEDMVSGKMKSAVAKAQEQAKQRGGVKEITTQPATYTDDDKTLARVTANISFNDSNLQQKKYIHLIKTDDGWKIKI